MRIMNNFFTSPNLNSHKTFLNWQEMIFLQTETVWYCDCEFCLKGGANSLIG